MIRPFAQNIWDLRAPVSVELGTDQHGAALRSAANVRAGRQCEEHIRCRLGRVASLVKEHYPDAAPRIIGRSLIATCKNNLTKTKNDEH